MARKNTNHTPPDYLQPIELVPGQSGGKGRTKEYLKRSVKITFKYFGAKLLTSAIIGAGEWLVCALLGIPGAVIYGIIACIGNLIPYVGPWAGCIIIGVASFFTEPIYALYTLLALFALQMIEQFVLTPLIVGQSLSVKPVLIVLITLAAGSFFGIWGIIFAVPVAAILKLGFQIYYQRKSFSEIDAENKRR
ncbi:MAG: AI-2E family transporter [Clostridia bacterium]|nr:AI-2E family transporter [Clostridia bacterium]MBQ9994072.1 AI-2E family transporter [Clostridia bacterium]